MADVACTLAGRRKEDIRLAAVVKDQQPRGRGAAAPEHDNVFVGESVAWRRNRARSESFSSSRARVLSTSGWLAACTSPSRCSPSSSTSAPQDSTTSWESTCGRRYSTGPDENLERTDRAQPALFTVEYALAKLIESYGVATGGVGRTQHRRVRRGHRGRMFRPADRGQGGVDARTPDARRTAWRHGRGGAEPRGDRRIPLARRRSRHGQRSGQLRRRGIRREHPEIPGSPRQAGNRGASGPHVARVPFAVDGSGGSGVHRLPVPPDAS